MPICGVGWAACDELAGLALPLEPFEPRMHVGQMEVESGEYRRRYSPDKPMNEICRIANRSQFRSA